MEVNWKGKVTKIIFHQKTISLNFLKLLLRSLDIMVTEKDYDFPLAFDWIVTRFSQSEWMKLIVISAKYILPLQLFQILTSWQISGLGGQEKRMEKGKFWKYKEEYFLLNCQNTLQNSAGAYRLIKLKTDFTSTFHPHSPVSRK